MRANSKVLIVLTLVVLLVSSVPISVEISNGDPDTNSETCDVAYNHLDVYKQDLYGKISNAMNDIETNGLSETRKEIKLSDNSDIYKRDIDVVLYAYMSDHPEKFWASYFNVYIDPVEDKAKGLKTEKEDMSKETLSTMSNKILGAVNDFTPSGSALVNKIMSIHEFIRGKVTYEEKTANGSNIYGALVEGRAECDGYALAFNYLCQTKLSLNDSLVLIGDIKGRDDSGHAWNIVKMENGNWYNMDVTWDDTTDNRNRYDYFLIGSQTSTPSGSFDSTRNIYYDYHITVSKDKYPYEAYSFLERNAAVIAVVAVLIILAIVFVVIYYNKKKKAAIRQAEMANAVNSGKYCAQCGCPIPPDQDFCSACGKKAKGKEDEKQ